MAPAAASTNGLKKENRPPRATKMIVPAIPLPYVQKRKLQDAARAKAREEAAAPKQEVVEAPRTPTPPPVAEIAPPVANGSDGGRLEKVEEIVEAVPSPESASPVTPTVEEEQTPAAEEPKVLAEEKVHGKQIHSTLQCTLCIDIRAEVAHETPSSSSHGPSSSSTYQMPPAFVPGYPPGFPPTNVSPPMVNNTSQRNVPNGQHQMHHPHPSVGSVMFGGPESTRSSPALPVHASNNMPYFYPPPTQTSGYGNAPQNMSNGYSSMGPPPPPGFFPRPDGFTNQAAANSYGRANISFGPAEGYSPSTTPMGGDQRMNNFDLSTPHSFQGSQSSAANEQEHGPFYNQYPTAVISNGSNGHIDEVRLYQQPRPNPPTGSQAVRPSAQSFSAGPQSDHYDGLMGYLQQQFADPAFADYTLELRYIDDRAVPVRIPGHNLMFARSPALNRRMTAQARDSDGLTVRTLLIETDDRYLRSDAFWMAAQRLYAWPLLEPGPSPVLNMAHQQSSAPGSPTERFAFALGYAAAGKILEIPPVIMRGAEIASQLLSWNTIEMAFDFALEGDLESRFAVRLGPGTGTPVPPTYGPAAGFLMNYALQFLIANFPAGFTLDTESGDSARHPRLPNASDSRPGQNKRLSSIKFGDHPAQENGSAAPSDSVTATLSTLLINLPFDLLKYVLESPQLGNVKDWASIVLRRAVMTSVIEERERRKRKVRESHIPNAERHANAMVWEQVGWVESVDESPKHAGIAKPSLSRRWLGFDRVPED